MEIFNTLVSVGGPAFALIGVLLTLGINLLIQRTKSSSDSLNSERTTLSTDQANFRSSILEQLNLCRKAVEVITAENHELQLKFLEEQERRLKLVEEIIILRQKIFRSKEEIDVLTARINKYEELNDQKAEATTSTTAS